MWLEIGKVIVTLVLWWVVYVSLLLMSASVLPSQTPTWLVVFIFCLIPIIACIAAGLIVCSLGYGAITSLVYGVVFLSPIILILVLMVMAALDQ